MIEVAMVRRMVRRGLILGPAVVVILGLLGGLTYAYSSAIGIALTLANLWLAGRVIGGLAENRPELLLAGAFIAFFLAFVLLAAAAVALRNLEAVEFPVAGVSMIGAHLTLVTWEAADAFLKLPPQNGTGTSSSESHATRS